MSMRVIGGSARGMRLECPAGLDVRPAPEMGRAALFNILRNDVEGAQVLDVFAGVGSVGIEALSRGAGRVVFVERSRLHAGFIEKNLARTRLADRAEVLVRDAFGAPEFLAGRRDVFDVIFVGPPFPLWREAGGKARLLALVDRLAELGVLPPGGRLVAQSDARDVLPEATARLTSTDRRQYGRNQFTFYEYTAGGAAQEPGAVGGGAV